MLVAQYLRMLLNERESYRARWACLAGKTPPGEISQAAVAKVIVGHLDKTADGSGQMDFRLWKDRVYRALSGQALTLSTVRVFAEAFAFNEQDKRQLWALLFGTTPDEAWAAFERAVWGVSGVDHGMAENTSGPLGPIRHSLNLVGIVEGEAHEPTSAVQYAVLAPSGRCLIFGDQDWVRSGQALKDFPDGAVVRRRSVTIIYGPWQDA